MMFGFGLIVFLLIGGLILALTAGGRDLMSDLQSGGRGPRTARQILDERFARGEIDREAYDEARARIDD